MLSTNVYLPLNLSCIPLTLLVDVLLPPDIGFDLDPPPPPDPPFLPGGVGVDGLGGAFGAPIFFGGLGAAGPPGLEPDGFGGFGGLGVACESPLDFDLPALLSAYLSRSVISPFISLTSCSSFGVTM